MLTMMMMMMMMMIMTVDILSTTDFSFNRKVCALKENAKFLLLFLTMCACCYGEPIWSYFVEKYLLSLRSVLRCGYASHNNTKMST